MALPRVLWVGLQFVIVVFPDHTHILVGWYFFHFDQILVEQFVCIQWRSQSDDANCSIQSGSVRFAHAQQKGRYAHIGKGGHVCEMFSESERRFYNLGKSLT